ncbi:hypothetical protein Gotur_019993, partial [Gossypium turneri]
SNHYTSNDTSIIIKNTHSIIHFKNLTFCSISIMQHLYTISDTSHKGPTQAQERGGLKLPQGPITRSKARQMRSKLNGTIQEFISKALDAYTKEKQNQDSLSCFQENQETESWSNFTVWSDFKNQENQDFKSWKSWSKKPNLTAKAHWISVTSINKPILVGNGLQAQ